MPTRTGALALLAALATPACLAADCMALRWGSDVVLRGELWWPASADPAIDLTLAVKEVL